MKYPFVLFFRYDKYSNIDTFISQNANKLMCTLHIINKKEKINLKTKTLCGTPHYMAPEII